MQWPMRPKENKKIEAQLSRIEVELAQIKQDLKMVLSILQPKPAVRITWDFSKQENRQMALSLPLNTVGEKYYIYGTDATGDKGAQLASGQTIAVTSSDATNSVFALVPDATPQPDLAQGIPTVASGAVNPVGVGGPITVTATVTNSDGSVAESLTDTITVTAAVPGVATSIGVLFEGPVSGT